MDDQPQINQPDRGKSRAQFLSKLHRYQNLLRTKWWVLVLAVIIAIAVQAVLSSLEPPSYVSYGRMIVSIKLAIPEGSVYTEELSNFIGTQTALMQSGIVMNRAHARVSALKPNLPPQPVSLKVSPLPKTTIFNLQAVGSDPEYTTAFLSACMEEYIAYKKEMRAQTSDTTVAGMTEKVLGLEKDLHKCDLELAEYQGTNSFIALQDAGTSAGNYLTALNQSLAQMKSEYDLLEALTLDENVQLQQEKNSAAAKAIAAAAGAGSIEPPAKTGATPGTATPPGTVTPSTEPSSEYLKAKQELLMAKMELKEMGQYLRPKHPKIKAKEEEISHKETMLEIYKGQSSEQLDFKKHSLALQIQNREKDIKEWEPKVLEINRKTAEYQRLKANQQRFQALYDKLLATMQTLDVNKEVSPESVSIMEKATPAAATRSKLSSKMLVAALIGLGLAFALLFLLDRLDDRLNSFTELQELFNETVLGQIPREHAAMKNREIQLIEPEDARHSFVEAYRNLRSSLLYMSDARERPRNLLVTSSVPNEGKSVTSANLAITMASAGSRVLLVDADLRKGALHQRFGVAAEPGLSESLSQGLNWNELVHATRVSNLFLLSRGAVTHKSSEFFINEVTEKFLKEAAAAYDYVVIDTAPVMAADDVTSLAPLVDGVAFVIRSEHTSARVARAALDLLYQRQVNILGLVFNAIRPSGADYYYYYKYKDYYKAYPTGKTARNAQTQTPEAREEA